MFVEIAHKQPAEDLNKDFFYRGIFTKKMIERFCLKVHTSAFQWRENKAYNLYGWLMSQVSEAFGDDVHKDGFSPISQYLKIPNGDDKDHAEWDITLLSDEASEELADTIDNITVIPLKDGMAEVTGSEWESLADPSEAAVDTDISTIHFLTTTSFKVNGRYKVLPDVEHIVSSMINQWNILSDDVISEDEKTAITEGLVVRGFKMHSSAFRLKKVSIPGFKGEITIEQKIKDQRIRDLWKKAAGLSQYTGLGIKTTLGMGGVSIN